MNLLDAPRNAFQGARDAEMVFSMSNLVDQYGKRFTPDPVGEALREFLSAMPLAPWLERRPFPGSEPHNQVRKIAAEVTGDQSLLPEPRLVRFRRYNAPITKEVGDE